MAELSSLPVPRSLDADHSGEASRAEMKRFVRDVFTPASAGEYGRAEWALHWLLAAALVLPLAVFAIGSAISYRQHQAEARDRLQRDLGTAYEHALKVFETFEISARYIDELFQYVSDEQIRAFEQEYNAQLRTLTDTLPQLADIWLIDRDGHPLVSGTVYPIPKQLDLSDRAYFRVHKNNEVQGTYIDDVVTARATNERGNPRFFALSRKRLGSTGQFAGVTTISISPDYFIKYYSQLPRPGIFALFRADGTILAGFPQPPPQFIQLPADGPLRGLMRAGSETGFVTLATYYDSRERMFAYRKLPRHAVYVVAGLAAQDIRAAWLDDMA